MTVKGSVAQLSVLVATAFVIGTVIVLYSNQSSVGVRPGQLPGFSPRPSEQITAPNKPPPRLESETEVVRNEEQSVVPSNTAVIHDTGQGREDTSKSPETKLGFMMAMHYSDQMTAASVNFRNLLCFVGRYMKDVRVIEPFLAPIGSTLGACLDPTFDGIDPLDMNTVKLSDVYDIDEWTNYAKMRQYAPIISWDDYTKIRPKKIILVHHQWYTKECDPSYMVNATKNYVTKNKFKVVKQVCLNFRFTGMFTNQGLIDFIYGDIKPNEAVVVFNRWGGIVPIVEDYRFSVRSTMCYRGSEQHLFHPSKQLASDMKEYSRRYMNGSKKYVAAMYRVEFFAIKKGLKQLPDNVQRDKLLECVRSIKDKLVTVKRERNINQTLLTMDVGKYGSSYFRKEKSQRLNNRVLNETIPEFFEIMFGQSFTQELWEDSFDSVAHFKAPGYIAIMQKHLAANSECLILAGGGTFQASTKILYNEIHHYSGSTISTCM